MKLSFAHAEGRKYRLATRTSPGFQALVPTRTLRAPSRGIRRTHSQQQPERMDYWRDVGTRGQDPCWAA